MQTLREFFRMVLEQIPRALPVTLGLALLYAGTTLLLRQLPRWDKKAPGREAVYKDFEGVDGSTEVRILRFYASQGLPMEGDSILICYGVVNAQSLEIRPHIDFVKPTLNRCVSDSPEEDTRYTLIARGADGREVSESFLVRVRPDPFTAPRVKRFNVLRKEIDRGMPVYLLGYEIDNAREVELDPPVTPLPNGPYGRFFVAPKKTLTLTLTVHGSLGRKARKQVTLDVPESGGTGGSGSPRRL